MQPIRLIAMDMDGTLLNKNQLITEGNLSALRRAAAAGIHLAVCSGRTSRDVSYFLSDANLNDCSVLALNGACCLLQPHAEPYTVHTLSPETVAATLQVLLQNNVTFAAFQKERVIVLQNDPLVIKPGWGTYVDRGAPEGYAYGGEALERFQSEGICKIVYIDRPNAERIQNIRKQLERIAGLQITTSWNDNLELMPVGVGKGTALVELADKLSIPQGQVMAIGDYDNDLDMLESAGVSVAMGNASPNVLARANYVTADNDHDGVAQAIRRLAL